MTPKAFEYYKNWFTMEMEKLLTVKGGDYSTEVDRLHNFKHAANLTGVSAQQVCFVYLAKHFESIAAYARNPEHTSTESVESRCLDLANYALLFAALSADLSNACDEETANEPQLPLSGDPA